MKLRFSSFLCLIIGFAASAQAQQQAVIGEAQGNKIYLKVDALMLRGDLDTLFTKSAGLQDQISNLSWSDVLENGTTPGQDVNFFGYDATGLGNVTTTGTFTGDSLVLNKDAEITGRLDVTDVTSLGDSLLVAGTVVLNDSLRVVKAASIGERLYVTGITALGDSVHVVGNVDFDALFNVDGAATFGSTVEVTGVGTFRDTLNVDGATLLNDSLNVDGNTYLEQDLQVDGNTNIGGTTNITGAVTLGDALSVTGKTSLGDSLLVTGGANFSSGVNVDGNTTLNAVTVDGDLDLNGNADISGTLDVHGATTLADSLTVEGETILNDTLKVNAPALMNDSLHVAGGAGFGSDVTVDGATALGGSLDVTGNTSLGGTLGVNGVTSLNDSLHVTGGADFDSGLNVDGNATLNTATVSGTTTLQGELTVNAEATFNDTVHFSKPALFSDSADFAGNVNVGGTMEVTQLIIDGVTIPALDNTDALPEGDTNLYFTAAREAALQAQLNQVDSLNAVLSATLDNLLNQLYDPATSTTTAATPVVVTTATLTATFDDGGAEPESAGFIFSTSPAFTDSTVYTVTPGAGSMSHALSGLEKGTTYYYKAFVVTIMGRAEGAVENFTTIDDASVTTLAVNDAGQTTATLRGSIAGNGGGTISAAGFKYGTAANLATATTLNNAATSGTYTEPLTDLDQNTTYYYHAFATNEAGTAVGDTLSFSTVGPCNGVFTLTYEGYTYPLIEAGGECWMAENLRAPYSNVYGSACAPEIGGTGPYSNDLPGNGDSFSCGTDNEYEASFGLLYPGMNSNTPNVCPTGWKLPTTTAFNALVASVGGDPLKLMSPENWGGTTTGNIGFNALPSGVTDDCGLGCTETQGIAPIPALSDYGSAIYWLENGGSYIGRIRSPAMFTGTTVWPWLSGGGGGVNRAAVRCIKQ